MRPEIRSGSFTWQRDIQNMNDSISNSNARRRIQDRFENEETSTGPFNNERSLRSTLANFTLPSVGVQPAQVIRVGAEKISKTLRDVRTTFGTLSQKLRRSTRRRVPFKNEFSPSTPSTTPGTRARRILGRTPTELYSPFGIETPSQALKGTKPRAYFSPQRRTPLRSCQNESGLNTRNKTSFRIRSGIVHQKHSSKSIHSN